MKARRKTAEFEHGHKHGQEHTEFEPGLDDRHVAAILAGHRDDEVQAHAGPMEGIYVGVAVGALIWTILALGLSLVLF